MSKRHIEDKHDRSPVIIAWLMILWVLIIGLRLGGVL